MQNMQTTRPGTKLTRIKVLCIHEVKTKTSLSKKDKYSGRYRCPSIYPKLYIKI